MAMIIDDYLSLVVTIVAGLMVAVLALFVAAEVEYRWHMREKGRKNE